MTIDVVSAMLGVEAIDVVLGAAAWQQPTDLGWFERSAGVNRLLNRNKRATRLLRVVDERGEQETWYAGRAGVSFAAAIERMAIKHDALRDSVVVASLGERVYVAEMRGTLVASERAPYCKAFADQLTEWLSAKQPVVALTGNGLDELDFDIQISLALNVDLATLKFRRAFTTMLRAGLFRWRTWVFVLVFVAMVFTSVAYFLTWAKQEPLDALVAWELPALAPAPPPRFQAGAELAAFVSRIADHDISLWHASGISKLRFNAVETRIELYAGGQEPPVLTRQISAPAIAPVRVAKFPLAEFHEPLIELFKDLAASLEFGEPFELHSRTHAQTLTTVIDTFPVTRLITLAERLHGLPIELHEIECLVDQGSITRCELVFAIQGTHSDP